MKILFVITSLSNGGAERVCATLANHFSKSDEVEILYFYDNVFYELESGVKKCLYEPKGKGLFRLFDKMKKIRSKCDEADVCLSFMDSTNILVLISNLFSKNKIVISEHSAHDFVGLKWRVLRRIFYPFAHALGVLSKDDFSYYSFVKNKALIYNPASFEADFSVKKENIILFVGRLEDVKGCDIFLKALALLDLNGFEVRILGDGSKRDEVEKLAKDLNVKAKFFGSVKDVKEHYKHAKIIVSSSRFEGLPMVLVESLFFDVLRVATPTSGARELINDGIDGFLSKDFEPKSLACSIKNALAANDEILANARKKIKDFDIENIAQKWKSLMK